MSANYSGGCAPDSSSILPTSNFYVKSGECGQKCLRFLVFFAAIGFVLVVLAACGPEKSGSNRDQLTANTLQIAQQFVQDGDVSRARAQMQALDVANPIQWLLYLTESNITKQAKAPETNALVRLSMALGLQAPGVLNYATDNNLLAGVPGVAGAAAQVSTANTGAVMVKDVPKSNQVAQATVTPAPKLPTATPAASVKLLEPTPTNTAIPHPSVKASKIMNVRGGPGTDYPVVGALDPGVQAEIIAKNPQADWWEVALSNGQSGWVYGSLVDAAGDTASIQVAANIPPPPPTSTPAPVVAAAPAATTAPAASASDQPYFKLVQKRMWSKEENGTCRGQHLLRIHVVDANGNPLNGVTLQGIYTGQIEVTGSQGKGDGIIEFDLYKGGEGFTVIKDVDGRPAQSDRAEGFTTQSRDIPEPTLIAAGYCTNATDCQVFYDSWGCNGHHSWEATFQRNY